MNVLAIVPTHDRMGFLSDALDSLEDQSVQPSKTVVTGNVPRPPRNEIIALRQSGLRGFKVEFIQTDDPIGTRLNSVVSRSDCDAFFVLCDDDKVAPTFIEKTSEVMERTGADVVFTDLQWFGDNSRICGGDENHPWVTSLIRRGAWEKVAGGFYDGPYFDWEFYLSLKDAGCGKFVGYHEPLFLYRSHPGQDGNKITPEMHAKFSAIVKARHKHKS